MDSFQDHKDLQSENLVYIYDPLRGILPVSTFVTMTSFSRSLIKKGRISLLLIKERQIFCSISTTPTCTLFVSILKICLSCVLFLQIHCMLW